MLLGLLLLGLGLLLTLWGAWLAQPRAGREPALPVNMPSSLPGLDFAAVQLRLTRSCMPCHQRQILPEVIARVEQARFEGIGGDSRLRILAELGELETMLAEGMPLSFDDQASLRRLFAATPGEFYLMLEKGLMPPPWAPELMRRIDWPYQALSGAERAELLRFSKPYSMRFLR